MINKTTILAVRTLVHLARERNNSVRSPRQIADALGESPTYLAKVTRLLGRADITRAEKGVYVCRPPREITLLEIVEACQGAIVGDYCRSNCDKRLICSYHAAAEELRAAMVGVLSQWTLARLMERTSSSKAMDLGGLVCLMAGRQPMNAAMR
jgi:Rrf2 family protein